MRPTPLNQTRALYGGIGYSLRIVASAFAAVLPEGRLIAAKIETGGRMKHAHVVSY